MPFEVYTGDRPGRPRRALLIAAALLAGTLGLAWQQSREARALAPETQVADTPLRVQPPKDWVVDDQDPQAFMLPVHGDGWRRRAFRFERRIHFDFERLSAFPSLEDLLRGKGLADRRTVTTLRPARIGQYDAIEVRHIVPFQIGQHRLYRERLVRMACLPRGHLITVVYDPLVDLRPADVAIMDDVCATLRIDDPSLTGDAATYLARAGLSIPLQEEWLVVGTDLPGVRGAYVAGTVDGWPAWSIGMYRTWLAHDRTPTDLLVDFAGDRWLLLNARDNVEVSRRTDGATVARIVHPRIGQQSPNIVAAYVVAYSDTRVAILFVHAGPSHAQGAVEVAERMSKELTVAALEGGDDVAALERAGVELVDRLQRRGALPRWGRDELRHVARGQVSGSAVKVVSGRDASGANASEGYTGWSQTEIGRQVETTGWELGPQAVRYVWQTDFLHGRRAVSVREQRRSGDSPVQRAVDVERGDARSRSFTPGPAFVPPPAESVIMWWVARGEPTTEAIVTVSRPLGQGANTAYYRRLDPDAEYRRVLIQDDYWPLGTVVGFDDYGTEPAYWRGTHWFLERASPPTGRDNP